MTACTPVWARTVITAKTAATAKNGAFSPSVRTRFPRSRSSGHQSRIRNRRGSVIAIGFARRANTKKRKPATSHPSFRTGEEAYRR